MKKAAISGFIRDEQLGRSYNKISEHDKGTSKGVRLSTCLCRSRTVPKKRYVSGKP